MSSIRAMVMEDFYKNSERSVWWAEQPDFFFGKRTWNSTVNTMNWAKRLSLS